MEEIDGFHSSTNVIELWDVQSSEEKIFLKISVYTCEFVLHIHTNAPRGQKRCHKPSHEKSYGEFVGSMTWHFRSRKWSWQDDSEVKAPTYKPGTPSSSPRTHVVEGWAGPPVVLWPMRMHIHTYHDPCVSLTPLKLTEIVGDKVFYMFVLFCPGSHKV